MPTNKMIEEKDFFTEENVPESNWFKFDKVGVRVMGEVVDIYNKPSKDVMFKDQKVFVLKKADGELVNVGISVDKDYLIGRTNMVVVGDMLGFEFKKEIPAAKKGYQPAKSIEVYHRKGEPKPEVAADDIPFN